MPDATVAAAPTPFEGASEMRHENANLLEAMDRRLGQDSRPESETAALLELEPQVRAFLNRGAATGVFVEDIKERTACQVLLDYWSSTLSHAGIRVTRARLASFDAARLPDLKDRPCPFVGLEAFRDRTFFFGRDKAVDSLLARVAEVPLVVVQGASGSGKSSLVIAGALPVLGGAEHVPRFRIVGPFTPGNTPIESLFRAVAAVTAGVRFEVAAEVAALRDDPGQLAGMLDGAGSAPVLLVVDQFEEVFTLCSEDDCLAMVAGLDALLRARPDDRVILTLREEFSNDLDKIEPLRLYLARHARFSMKEWSMGYDELKAAVERPAALVNLQFAPGIVDELVKSVLEHDTRLPLLQFALRQLWDLRDRNRITREVYKKIGSSPLAALEQFADSFFNSLRAREERDEVERILLQLVHIDRMLEPYRQPRLRSELLATGNPRTPEVLELLAREEFVRIKPTAGGRDAAVEVKHEALLRNWPRYIDWIKSKRERVRQRIALTEAAQRWLNGGRSATEGLLSGWQLQEVEHLVDLSELEKEYVRASAEAADRDRIAREEALLRQERRRWILGFSAVVLVVLVALAWYLDRQSERRSFFRQTEDVQIQIARAREASTRGQLDNALTQPLLALAGIRRLEAQGETGALRAQAREMLLLNLRHAADLRRLFVTDGAVFHSVAFHPTRPNVLLAFGGTGGKTYLAGVGEPFAKTLDTCGTELVTVTAVAFDPTGRRLAAGCSDGTLSVWSVDDWRKLGENKRVFERTIWTIAFSPDGRLIAAGGHDKQVALVALAEDGAPTGEPPVAAGGTRPIGYVWSVAFSPAGDTLLAGDGVGTVLACKGAAPDSWNCAKSTPYQGEPKKLPEEVDAIRALSYAADGTQIAVGRWKGGVEVWDGNFSAKSRLPVDVGQSLGPVYSLAFFDACGRRQLAIGTPTGLLLRPADAGPRGSESPVGCALPRSASVGDETYGVAFHGPSGLLAAATRGGYVAVLDPAATQDPLPTMVPAMPKEKGQPVRAAIVAEAESTAWVAVPIIPTEPDKANLAVRRLRDGRIDDGGDFIKFAAGDGVIQRLSGSRQRRYLATLGCVKAPSARTCTGDTHEVVVWRLEDGFTGLTSLVSLGARDFDRLVPSRIALSPDGLWLVVSFERPATRLLVASLDGRDSRNWIDTELQPVREIAFSQDSKYFAAGGAALQPQAGVSVDQVQLWTVGGSGLEPSRYSPPTLTSLANKVWELAFAADERGRPLLLAGGEYGAIDRWDVGSGRLLGTLRADSRPISQIAFSRSESLVAAADSQNVVRLWDTSRWIPLQLTPPTDRVQSPGFLAFGGNGAWLASGADRLQLWDLDVGSLQRKICALLREPRQRSADNPTPMWRRVCEAP